MCLLFWIIMTCIIKIVDNSYARRQCMVEARMLISTSMTSQHQQSIYRASGRHHPRIQPRFKRQFMLPMPVQHTTPDPESVQRLSLCPWDDVLDVNMTRIPNILPMAVCHHDNGNNQCDFSFSRLMSDPSLLQLLSLETECALVYSQIFVKYECCEAGRYSIRDEWVDWPVACACARKRIRTGPTAN